MQREQVLKLALRELEQYGLATGISLERIAGQTSLTADALRRFWPDRQAMLYDALRYHGSQIDAWRHQLLHDNTLSVQQKLLKRYEVLTEHVHNQRYPGCLFIAACSFYPDTSHPIHQLADQQKQDSLQYTQALLTELDVDNPALIAQQMEIILEGCLSRLLVKRHVQDVDHARLLAEDVLTIALCRKNGALG
ncbi:transcriptional regulator [Enterobacteriaceae bacterium LUAb1]